MGDEKGNVMDLLGVKEENKWKIKKILKSK